MSCTDGEWASHGTMAAVAGTWLALAVTAALGQGPDLGEPADPPPAPAVAIWETPGHLILPDKPLLDRGLVLLQRTAENQQETLTLVRCRTARRSGRCRSTAQSRPATWRARWC